MGCLFCPPGMEPEPRALEARSPNHQSAGGSCRSALKGRSCEVAAGPAVAGEGAVSAVGTALCLARVLVTRMIT